MDSSNSPKSAQAHELAALIRASGHMSLQQAVVIDFKLLRLRVYQESMDLQILHSRALLERMRGAHESASLEDLSNHQKQTPLFSRSGTLQGLYAQGLVLRAQKEATTEVHTAFLNKLFALPNFPHSAEIQRATAALLLESIANCRTTREAAALEKYFERIPRLQSDLEIGRMRHLAKGLIEKTTERQAVVKVDLSEKTPVLVRLFSRLLGLGEYRMRVWLGGSPRYKHVVVKVAARTEQAAREAVQKFVDSSLAEERMLKLEILDIFPPGNNWDSGRYPMLSL